MAVELLQLGSRQSTEAHTMLTDTGRQSARHGASRHAPPTAGAVPSSPARPARPQRKIDE